MKSDVTELLKQYGFTLHKWFSNDHKIIASHAHSSHDFSKNQTVRTLGIQWNMDEDSFLYSVQTHVNVGVFNKRVYYQLSQEFTTLWDSLALLHSGVSILCSDCG